MAIQITGTVARSDGSTHATSQAEAGAAVVRDITAPLMSSEAELSRHVGGATLVYIGAAARRLTPLAELWRDMVTMRETVWLLPTTLYTTMLPVAVLADVRAPRWFVVESQRGPRPPAMRVRPNVQPPHDRVVYGTTDIAGGEVFVTYSTFTGRYPPSPGERRDHDVFRQAKVSETLVHEFAVHAIALLARHWDTGAPLRDHYDGWPATLMNPGQLDSYQSPLGSGVGRRALLADANPAHFERGVDLEEQAYWGVTRANRLNENLGYRAPNSPEHRRRARFLRGVRL